MKIRRKFNLNRIGLFYETIDIEMESQEDNPKDAEELILKIDAVFKLYCDFIKEKKVK